jgi:hypothetical protein
VQEKNNGGQPKEKFFLDSPFIERTCPVELHVRLLQKERESKGMPWACPVERHIRLLQKERESKGMPWACPVELHVRLLQRDAN